MSIVMGSTIVEKIVSRAVGRMVHPGEFIEALEIDKLYFNEVICPPALINFEKDFKDIFEEYGMQPRFWDESKVAFIPDHTVPSSSEMVSRGINLMKKFAVSQGVKMYKEGDGIEHTVASEDGFVLPGEIVLATDSHTCTQGALAALAFGVGTTDSEYALATGELYNFTVPETIKFRLVGSLGKGTYAKDLILYILGTMKEGGCSKRVAELTGETVEKMPMDGRFTICNMAVEMGARTGIINPDEILKDYLEEVFQRQGKSLGNSLEWSAVPMSDPDAHYHSVFDTDATKIEPMVALPHSPANVKPVSEVVDPINKVFIGACTNARESDLLEASKVISGHKVHPEVDLVVVPASRKVYNWAMKNKILEIFAEAGANIESSNCGPCFGKHMGVLAPGDRCLSTSNRNYRGRMGSADAFIYLSSPATAAATAIEGRLTDPRKYLN